MCKLMPPPPLAEKKPVLSFRLSSWRCSSKAESVAGIFRFCGSCTPGLLRLPLAARFSGATLRCPKKRHYNGGKVCCGGKACVRRARSRDAPPSLPLPPPWTPRSVLGGCRGYFRGCALTRRPGGLKAAVKR